jgi:hypothetical protein
VDPPAMTTAKKERTSLSSSSKTDSFQLASSSRRTLRRKVSSETKTSMPTSKGKLKTISLASTANRTTTNSMATTSRTSITNVLNLRNLRALQPTSSLTTLEDSLDSVADVSSYLRRRAAKIMVQDLVPQQARSIRDAVYSSILSRVLMDSKTRKISSCQELTCQKRCRMRGIKTLTQGWLRSSKTKLWSAR